MVEVVYGDCFRVVGLYMFWFGGGVVSGGCLEWSMWVSGVWVVVVR